MDPLQRAPTNQSVPLVDYDVAAADQALLDAVDAFGGDHAADIRSSLTPVGQLAGSAETREHWHRANENEPVLRTNDRFGERIDEVRVPSVVALADDAGRRLRAHGRTVGVAEPGGPPPAGRRLLRLGPVRAGAHVPDHHDVRRRSRPAGRRRPRQAVDHRSRLHHLRLRAPPTGGEGRAAGRHGHDREAGRLRPAHHHHDGEPHRHPRRVPAHRSQVVHVGADERRVPRARAGARGRHLLRGAARAARRKPQRPADRPAQGQARQPLQRLERDRAARRRRHAARRRGARHPHDHRDGLGHPDGLHPRLGQHHAQGRWRRRPSMPPTAPRSARRSPTSRR